MEFFDGGTHHASFARPEAAYDFWLGLRRGIRAKLFQNGILVGEGNGLESNGTMRPMPWSAEFMGRIQTDEGRDPLRDSGAIL